MKIIIESIISFRRLNKSENLGLPAVLKMENMYDKSKNINDKR